MLEKYLIRLWIKRCPSVVHIYMKVLFMCYPKVTSLLIQINQIIIPSRLRLDVISVNHLLIF
jgi:hypothetical protein